MEKWTAEASCLSHLSFATFAFACPMYSVQTDYAHIEIAVTFMLSICFHFFGHNSAPFSRIWTNLVLNEAELTSGPF